MVLTLIDSINRQVTAYLEQYPEETLPDLLSQLSDEGSDTSAPYLSRTNFRGHITCSAFVTNEARTHALLINHVFLQRWLPPGGHYEGDDTLQESASREVFEETGVKCHIALESIPLDIDSHPIPANEKKGEAAHVHHDFLYLAVADDQVDPCLQEEEVNGAKWLPIQELASYDNRTGKIALKVIKTTLVP